MLCKELAGGKRSYSNAIKQGVSDLALTKQGVSEYVTFSLAAPFLCGMVKMGRVSNSLLLKGNTVELR